MAIPIMSLGNSAINALLKNKTATREFPFLLSIPKVLGKNCRSCGGSGAPKMVTDYNRIKKKIAGLSSSRVRVLKSLLNTAEIIMTYRTGAATKTIRL